MTESLWTVVDVAKHLNIQQKKVWLLVRTENIPYVRIGRSLRFRPESIRAWVDAGGWEHPIVAQRQKGDKGPERGNR